MSETAKFKGRRAELEMEVRSLELRAEALLKAMRDNLDPTVRPDRIRGDLVLEQAIDLERILGEIRDGREQLLKINEILGR